MNDKDVLDDLRFEEIPPSSLGTNKDFMRGMIIGWLIQMILWIIAVHLDDPSSVDSVILNIKALGISLLSIELIVCLCMVLGSFVFTKISKVASQELWKNISFGLCFSVLSILGLLAYIYVLQGGIVHKEFSKIAVMLFLIQTYASLVWLLIFKRKFLMLGAIFLLLIPMIYEWLVLVLDVYF